MIVTHVTGYSARQIDHEAERQFGHRVDEARPGVRHQHADFRGGLDVDFADIDGDPDKSRQPRQRGDYLRRTGRHAVGDDDPRTLRRGDQASSIERPVVFGWHLRDEVRVDDLQRQMAHHR